MTVRRRIYDHYCIEDCTGSPHHFLKEWEPGEVELDDPPPLLVDREDLWDRLRAARREYDAAQDAIREAWQVGVPLDEVEVEVGRIFNSMMSYSEGVRREWDHDEWDRQLARLLRHMGQDPERHYRLGGRGGGYER